MSADHQPAFRPLTGIYEPSAIQQLEDGRFLIVEDEKEAPFSLLSLDATGAIRSAPLQPDADADIGQFNDLEGLVLDRAGYLYATTSHSRNSAGKEKKSRDKLVRFRIEGDRMVDPRVIDTLKPALLAAHPVLADAAARRDVKDDGGLNIEALEIDHEAHHLLIGFRSPLLDQCALVARVNNLAGLFDAGATPVVSPELITLDLDGDGIRAMAHLPASGDYFLSSGPVGRTPAAFRLWHWNGQHTHPARAMHLPGIDGFARTEGISAARIGDRDHLILVSDDGSRDAGREARYLLIDPLQLVTAS
jgi:hypothetical protein